jgi:spermidine/putrescine transport system permease protein
MENKQRVAVLATPLALLLVLLFLLPLSSMVIYSIRGGTFFEKERFILTLNNYRALFSNPSFINLFLRTVLMSLSVGILAVLFSYPIAYFLAFRSGAHRVTLLTLMIVPAWTSYLLRIVALKFLLGSNGLINSILISLGLINEGLPILLYSTKAVVITLVYVWIPFASLPIFLVLDRIDRGLLEASADLGCPPWQTFLRVTLPLSIPGVIASLLYVFIPTLGDYVTPMLMGGVQGSMYYGNLIQMQFGEAMEWPMGSTFSVFLVITIVLLLFVFSRLIRIQNFFKS